ncbi:hypothetical protein DNTS_010083 [Danionella cerebrum]|uniref:Uncharacterized protein n=1 Tax=Danionella cerebrum TaxID=2873325 RepID=A0A553N3M7_9TELE|nr:hypothetical protein DNTS_010083 [Danionella translucida]
MDRCEGVKALSGEPWREMKQKQVMEQEQGSDGQEELVTELQHLLAVTLASNVLIKLPVAVRLMVQRVLMSHHGVPANTSAIINPLLSKLLHQRNHLGFTLTISPSTF